MKPFIKGPFTVSFVSKDETKNGHRHIEVVTLEGADLKIDEDTVAEESAANEGEVPQ